VIEAELALRAAQADGSGPPWPSPAGPPMPSPAGPANAVGGRRAGRATGRGLVGAAPHICGDRLPAAQFMGLR
jgi:hypothetical protein